MKKKFLFYSILILTFLFSVNLSAQFLHWNWWKQNPALSLIGFNNTLNPIRSGGAVAEGTFTPGFGYRSLLPSNLTSKKAISITQSDNLQYTRGSLQGGDGSGVVFESFNPNQGSLEFWVRPNWTSGDGLVHYLFMVYVDGNNYIEFRDEGGGLTYLVIKHGGTSRTVSKSISWIAGTWYHIVAVWDIKNTVNGSNYSGIYLNNNFTGQTSALGTPASVASTFQIGQWDGYQGYFNGVLAGRILNRPLTSTEVTALYASGAGHTDSFTVSPDVVWLGVYSDSDSDAIFQHRGQQVTAISNGATESTLTLGQAVGLRAWKNDDDVLIQDGCGYYKRGKIDEPGGILTTDTSLDVDNGAGALVTDLDKVGRSLDFDATYYAQAANNTIHDITTEDISISAWVKPDKGYSADYQQILWKESSSMYRFFLVIGNGEMRGQISDGVNVYTLTGNTDVRDDKWHHIAIVFDRDNADNCKIYLDGYENGTTNKSGTLPAGSLTNAAVFTLGTKHGSELFKGQIRDVKLYYAAGDHWTDAQVLYQAQHPLDYTANAGTMTDYWRLDDNAATTVVVGSVNNLTASANTDTFDSQEAFISKSLICDGSMEN